METNLIPFFTPYAPKPGGVIQTRRHSFREAGQNSFIQPPAQNPDEFTSLQNVLPGITGNLLRRWGYQLWDASLINIRRLYEFERDSDGVRQIIGTCADGTGVSSANNAVRTSNENGSTDTLVFTPAAGATHPRCVVSRSYTYFVDSVAGDQKKWSGPSGTLTNWGITKAATAVSVGAPVSGAVTLTKGRNYFAVFQNPTTLGTSDLNPVSASSGPITNQNNPLSNIPVSADTQVTTVLILATADGGNQEILYLAGSVANGVTTFTDSMPETTLLNQNIYLETDSAGVQHGVADNAVPPNGQFPIKHRGRLYLANGQFLRASKSLDETITSTGATTGNYEECWPAAYELDVSQEAEKISGLLSDGTTLYIGTERHVRRLYGDGPLNWEEPVTIFNQTGVLSQETWKVVFLEGQPLGTMWLTPDFRVIGSDFNSYQDVGTPIQDVLNTINTANSSKACAAYFALGAYNLFLLAIPTGANTENDTLCVYDLKARKWYVWKLTDSVLAMLNNVQASGIPQLIFWALTGKGYTFNTTNTQDRVNDTPVSFTCSAKTGWLDFGDPSLHKWLNEAYVVSSDSNFQVDLEGAITDADFTTPTLIFSNTALKTSPFNEQFLSLVSYKTRYKFFRFTFHSLGTNSVFLDGYDFRALPIR